MDSDRNGKPDLVFVRGAFSRGILIDADEDSLAGLKAGDAADELLKAKKVDAELAVIVQGNAVWAIYDTDNDSRFDLALMTDNGLDEVEDDRGQAVQAIVDRGLSKPAYSCFGIPPFGGTSAIRFEAAR